MIENRVKRLQALVSGILDPRSCRMCDRPRAVDILSESERSEVPDGGRTDLCWGCEGDEYEPEEVEHAKDIRAVIAYINIATQLAEALSHCRMCQECGDGPCCDICGSASALDMLAKQNMV